MQRSLVSVTIGDSLSVGKRVRSKLEFGGMLFWLLNITSVSHGVAGYSCGCTIIYIIPNQYQKNIQLIFSQHHVYKCYLHVKFSMRN